MERNSRIKTSVEPDGLKIAKPKKKVKKKRYVFLKILILMLICIIVFMTSALYGYRYIVEGTNQANNEFTEENSEVFKVSSGSSASAIANQLKSQGYIKNVNTYKLISKIMGFDNAYRAGKYLIQKDMNYYGLMLRLTSEPLKNPTKDIMIPEGKTILETAKILSSQGYVDEVKYLNSAKKLFSAFAFLKDVKATEDRKYPLEGYLYPDTYKMDEGWTEEQLVERMLNEFNRVFPQEYYDRAKELNMTVDQVITLASLIEMEALYPTDFKKISSVFHNRLKINMPLQSDATVQYARIYAGIGRTTSVLTKDLEIDSPYNTYKVQGFPPGPICSPRKDSIEAALYPEKTKYLYFFAKPDGTNVYNETLDGHNRDQQKFGVSGQQ